MCHVIFLVPRTTRGTSTDRPARSHFASTGRISTSSGAGANAATVAAPASSGSASSRRQTAALARVRAGGLRPRRAARAAARSGFLAASGFRGATAHYDSQLTEKMAGQAEKGNRIVVGMSGGVDSSVAALLLKRAGHDVRGLFMRCWEDAGDCPAGEDAAAAAAAAAAVGIELDAVDLVADYRREVFAGFLAELRAGRTPNPDVWCNARIKFSAFAQLAGREHGAERIATGHYARIDPAGPRLLRAEDENKDQTYFLYRLRRPELEQALFPLGGMLKAEVRALARAAGLPTAERRESMGICFIGKRPLRQFLAEHIPERPGAILDERGRRIGEHAGAHLYTIGQRSGLGLGGAGAPWYVAGKDIEANTVTAVRGSRHRLLLCGRVRLIDASWVSGRPPPPNWVYTCRLRHRMEPAPCTLEHAAAGRATVAFAAGQAAVAAGQALVVYDGINCLGGGTIDETFPPEDSGR